MRKNPLFARTVTVYHGDAEHRQVVRTVLRGVFWQHGRRRTPDANGTTEGAAMLLVVPETTARYGTDYTLAPGDRLCPGEGPELDWADWPAFVPGARAEVAVIQYVLPMTRGDKLHHVEAGAWWTGTGTGAHSLTN